MCVCDLPSSFARDFVLKLALQQKRLFLQFGERFEKCCIRVQIVVAIAFPVREMGCVFITQCCFERFNRIDHMAL